MSTSLVGQTCGPFRIESAIGKGGMGAVYKALDTSSGERVALKVVELGPDREQPILRLQREAATLAELRHPNVVGLRGGPGTEGDHLYFAMELLTGKSLEQILSERRRLLVAEAVTIARAVLSGLDAAHFHGMVHRDVKPSNVFVTQDGSVKVLDFGLTHVQDSTRLTEAGSILGTPCYMSPEQCEGRPVDARSDVYGVGCLLYQLLAGRPPFIARDALAVLAQHLNAPVPPLPISVPPELTAVLARALEKDVLKRFSSAGEFGLALAACPIETVEPESLALLVADTVATRVLDALDVPARESRETKETKETLAGPPSRPSVRPIVADAPPAEEVYWRGAVALVKTIASCIAIAAVAMSFRPRVVTESEVTTIYGPIITTDGRQVSPVRFEPALTLGALAAIGVAFGVHALLRVYWSRGRLVRVRPDQPLTGARWVLTFGTMSGVLCITRWLLGDAVSVAQYMLLAGALLLGIVVWFFVFMTALDGERLGRAFWREWKLWVGLFLGFVPLAGEFVRSIVKWVPPPLR